MFAEVLPLRAKFLGRTPHPRAARDAHRAGSQNWSGRTPRVLLWVRLSPIAATVYRGPIAWVAWILRGTSIFPDHGVVDRRVGGRRVLQVGVLAHAAPAEVQGHGVVGRYASVPHRRRVVVNRHQDGA